MFFKKKAEQDYSGKKYLLIIVMLILLVAIVLGVSDLFSNNDEENNIAIPSFDELLQEHDVLVDSYLAKNTPMLNGEDRIIGDIDAPIKIFVYEDYDNEFSAKFFVTTNTIIRENYEDIAVVVRPYISESADSKEKAMSLVCAYQNGNFAQTRDYFFNSLLGVQSNENIEYSSDCLTEEEKLTRIEKLRNEADSLGVYGSPTIFIGNDVIIGARPYSSYTNSDGEVIEGMSGLVKNILAQTKS